MKEMGIVDEGLALRALQIMGGDLQVPKYVSIITLITLNILMEIFMNISMQAAVDLIFSGWEGGDEAMQ